MKIPNKYEVRKPSKTLAGVTPIAVMAKPRKCRHGVCLYCPSLDVPQSYTPKSPPVLRAKRLKYDPCKQVISRLKAFQLMNHPTDKIELIIMGGTFLDYPMKYQYDFIKKCYDALNNKISKNLNEAKKINEKARHRCIALCIETRPDTINKKTIKRILDFGATRVELGVQCLDDKIYKKINRGHNLNHVIEATKFLKNSGFKIGYHMMPGLPFSNIKKDFEMSEELFKNQNFKPDQIKIYPCQVIKGSALEKLYKNGRYSPYPQKQTRDLIIKIMKIIPNYCRVMRIMREIPPDYLTAGILRIDLRKDIEEELKKNILTKNSIQEIRFREIGFAVRDKYRNKRIENFKKIENPKFSKKNFDAFSLGKFNYSKFSINKSLKLKMTQYKASNGEEYFLEIVNKENILFALCRLRIFGYEAFIRELHVYGPSLSLRERSRTAFQHKGFGRKLLIQAEDIAKKHKPKIKKLKIISGVGAREYYKKLGYKLDKNKIYMVKNLF